MELKLQHVGRQRRQDNAAVKDALVQQGALSPSQAAMGRISAIPRMARAAPQRIVT